jgi:glycosyltransferase involved in cell wall biosynthesis
VFNGEKYLAETLTSVLNQSLPHFEIVIIDNGSTDKTGVIIDSFASKTAKIRSYRNMTTVDMASNWNIALSSANGDYKLLLSADDILESDFLSRTSELLDANEDLAFVTAEHRLKKKSSLIFRNLRLKEGPQVLSCAQVLLRNPYSINFTLFRSSYLARVSLSENFIFRAPYYTCDYDLWLRMAQASFTGSYIAEPLGIYRVHDDSLSSNIAKMHRHTAMILLKNKSGLLRSNPWIFRLTLIRIIVRITRLPSPQSKSLLRLTSVLMGRVCAL